MNNGRSNLLRHIFVGMIVLFVIGAAAPVSCDGLPNRNRVKAQRISDAVLSFPVGSSRARVTAFLDSEGIGYSYVGDKAGINITSAVADNGYSSKNLSGYIVAIIRNTSGGLVSGDVQYFFFFDKSGKLLKATAEEVFTGP